MGVRAEKIRIGLLSTTIFGRRVKPQAIGGRSVLPLTSNVEGGEIVLSHMKI
jgi:hypothetical protein